MKSTAEERAKVPKIVRSLGLVSFLTDVSADMVTPLLPLFLVSLGASNAFVGTVDGAANSAAALLKIIAGRLGDRPRWLKRLTLIGYGIAFVARPLMGLATAPWPVLTTRVSDRVGK